MNTETQKILKGSYLEYSFQLLVWFVALVFGKISGHLLGLPSDLWYMCILY